MTRAAAIPSTAPCWATPGFRIDYTRGLVRVGVQSAISHPDAEALLAKLMKEKGLEVPPNFGSSICLTTLCKGDAPDADAK